MYAMGNINFGNNRISLENNKINCENSKINSVRLQRNKFLSAEFSNCLHSDRDPTFMQQTKLILKIVKVIPKVIQLISLDSRDISSCPPRFPTVHIQNSRSDIQKLWIRRSMDAITKNITEFMRIYVSQFTAESSATSCNRLGIVFFARVSPSYL